MSDAGGRKTFAFPPPIEDSDPMTRPITNGKRRLLCEIKLARKTGDPALRELRYEQQQPKAKDIIGRMISAMEFNTDEVDYKTWADRCQHSVYRYETRNTIVEHSSSNTRQ